MPTHRITPQDSYHQNNLEHLRIIVEALASWRYKVQSTFLVASSALLALSFSMPPLEAHSSSNRVVWYYLLLSCNALQLLSTIVVLGIILKTHIGYSRSANRELLNPAGEACVIVYTNRKCVDRLLTLAEVSSFAFFVLTILILSVCRILAIS